MAGPPPPPMRYGPPPQLGRPFGPRPMPPIPPPFGMILEMLLIGWENMFTVLFLPEKSSKLLSYGQGLPRTCPSSL